MKCFEHNWLLAYESHSGNECTFVYRCSRCEWEKKVNICIKSSGNGTGMPGTEARPELALTKPCSAQVEIAQTGRSGEFDSPSERNPSRQKKPKGSDRR
jgi:hypothetical protein